MVNTSSTTIVAIRGIKVESGIVELFTLFAEGSSEVNIVVIVGIVLALFRVAGFFADVRSIAFALVLGVVIGLVVITRRVVVDTVVDCTVVGIVVVAIVVDVVVVVCEVVVDEVVVVAVDVEVGQTTP